MISQNGPSVGLPIKFVTGQLGYSLLVNVAKLVVSLPHYNADEEHVFSLVKQNETEFRSALSLDGTITVKMASKEPCYISSNHPQR